MKTFNEKTYRPLPEQLTIKPSNIDGLGLHTNEYLDAGTVLGETHVLVHNIQFYGRTRYEFNSTWSQLLKSNENHLKIN